MIPPARRAGHPRTGVPPVVPLALALMLPADARDQKGWIDLLQPGALQKVDAKWVRTDSAALFGAKQERLKPGEPLADGPVWVNGPGRAANLVSKESFGDCEIHVEFLIAKKSNAGVKFHGLYEIQMLDTFGKPADTGNSMGGVYPRASAKGGYHYLDKGTPPRVNAARPAGEWQTLDAVWRAPRFDAAGKRTAPGVVVKAVLNGQVIHENAVVQTPTGANWVKPDTASGPILLQGDHGPVAFRAVRVRRL